MVCALSYFHTYMHVRTGRMELVVHRGSCFRVLKEITKMCNTGESRNPKYSSDLVGQTNFSFLEDLDGLYLQKEKRKSHNKLVENRFKNTRRNWTL